MSFIVGQGSHSLRSGLYVDTVNFESFIYKSYLESTICSQMSKYFFTAAEALRSRGLVVGSRQEGRRRKKKEEGRRKGQNLE